MGIESINKRNLITCFGCYCAYDLCYYDFPACLGITEASECLCIGHEFCLDSTHAPFSIGFMQNSPNFICQLSLYCFNVYLKKPTLCCKHSYHYCFSVGEASFPPDNGFPNIFACSGVMCYPKFGFCVKFGDVKWF
jgi:hypothetical protein